MTASSRAGSTVGTGYAGDPSRLANHRSYTVRILPNLADDPGDSVEHQQPADGTWRFVVMNVDRSPAVQADLSIGAEFPHLLWIGIGLLAAGGALVAIGVALLYFGVRGVAQPVPRPSGG